MFQKSCPSRAAFTLGELLIAMAVLGVISALTVPQVYVAVQASKVKASAKEAINTIKQVAMAAAQNDDYTAGNSSMGSYIASKINFAKSCNTSPVTNGCWDAADPGGWDAGYTAGVFHSGVYVQWWKDVSSAGILYFYFDWTNGSKTFRGDFGDQMGMVCNLSGATYTGSPIGTVKPGECRGPDDEPGSQATLLKIFSS
jgi:prepilin-type N-terminal cleavage/methylation domain-containing protein